MTVIINATFAPGGDADKSFANAAEALLRGLGLTIHATTTPDGHMVITAHQSASDVPAEITPSTPELTIDLPADSVIAASENPQEVPTLEQGVVVLKNLSSACLVPFSVDRMLPATVLKVQDLSSTGELISFSYSGMSFKMPPTRGYSRTTGVDVRNNAPEYTYMSIRLLVDFVGTNSDIQPILFKIVQCDDGEASCVVFGQDVASLVDEIMVKKFA